MRLDNQQRELIERALDVLALLLADGRPPTIAETRLYQRAVTIVRELPSGERRLRSDFQTKRQTPQADLPIEPDPFPTPRMPSHEQSR